MVSGGEELHWCSTMPATDFIQVDGPTGLTVGDEVAFTDSGSGLVAGTVYYVKQIGQGESFSISTTANGPVKDLTAPATDTHFYTLSSLPRIKETVPKEAIPLRLGPSLVYPSEGPMTVFEPDSPTTKVRPLSIKSPQDYNDTNAPSVTALSNAQECSMATSGLVTCTGHGFIPGDAIKFADSGLVEGIGGVVAGTTYYVISSGRTADAFYFSSAPNGGAFTVTVNQENNIVYSSYRQLFDFSAGGNYFTVPGGVTGVVADSANGTMVDYMCITWDSTSQKSVAKGAALDLGSAGVDLAGKKYLVLDLSLEWSLAKPSSSNMGNGRLVGQWPNLFAGVGVAANGATAVFTSEQQVKDWQEAWANWNEQKVSGVSGFCISLYSDQACSAEDSHLRTPGLGRSREYHADLYQPGERERNGERGGLRDDRQLDRPARGRVLAGVAAQHGLHRGLEFCGERAASRRTLQ